jgi:hypothetical protein
MAALRNMAARSSASGPPGEIDRDEAFRFNKVINEPDFLPLGADDDDARKSLRHLSSILLSDISEMPFAISAT